MHAIQILLARPEVERLGWVLLHFVWQGALIAALCALALAALRRKSANLRYLIACSALVAMAACLPATWFLVSGHAGNSKALHDDGVAEPRGRPGGTAEAPESRGRVSPRLEFRVSERRDHVPDTAFEEPAVSRERVERPNGREGDSAVAWLDRIAAALPWLVTTWLIGVFGLSIRLAIGWRDVHRLRRRASLPADGAWQAVLSQLCDRLHIRSSVKVLESGLVDVPTMIGWLRPVILWPPALLAGLSVDQFEALLAHELAHVRRHDYLVNLIQTAIETLLFYLPAVWWLSRRIRHERECCCDDLAVAACGNRLSYARALATLEELRSPARQLALAADGGHLLTRIRRIVGVPARRRRVARHWLLGLSMSATLLIVGVAIGLANLATGDEPAKKSDSTTPIESLNRPSPAGQPNADKPDQHPTSESIRIELIVQKVGTNDEIIKGPPEEIGDRIKQLPHVTAVARAAMDVRSPKEDLNEMVYNVWPPKPNPDKHDQQTARRLGRTIVPGDRRERLLGAVLALKLRSKVGDTIQDSNCDYAVLGVVEEPDLTQLNAGIDALMKRPPRIAAFVVSTDIPRDNWPDHQTPMTELCQRIEGLGEGIIVVRAKPPEKITWAARVPIAISGKVLDDATGKPITSYDKEGGRVDPKDAKNVNWGAYLVRGAGDSEGTLSGSIDWYGGWRERIVASGYAPQEIVIHPLGPANTCINGVTVRLKRMTDKPGEHGTPIGAQSSDASNTKNLLFDFVVQKAQHDGNLDETLPQELVARISKIPHVADATPGLMDVVSVEEHKLPAVYVVGLPADAPLIQSWKIKAGRRFEDRDRRLVMLGTGLAKALKVTAGDTIKLFNTDLPIVGIFECDNRSENMTVLFRLSDLQEFTNLQHRVSTIFTRTDILKDDTAEHRAQLAEVRKHIRLLDKELAVEPANQVPAEVTITIDPALAAELRALDAMRAGTSTNFEKVDETGRKLLDRFNKPEEQGQIYYTLLHLHGQSGLQTPEHMIDYAQKALKFPLGSRQELMVYIYWGDVLNVRKTEEPWPKQRSEAAAVYLKGLKRVWQYHAPVSPPELPDPPPIDDAPDGPEHEARRREMERYMALRNEADFIKDLIYDRKIFIRPIADMYHRRPATAAEIEALHQQAQEIVGDDAAVAQLMAAVEAGEPKEHGDDRPKDRGVPEPDRIEIGNAKIDAGDRAWSLLGLRLSQLSAEESKELQDKFKRHGAYRGALRVDEVRSGSPAAKERLERGDLLVGMHIWETVRVDQVNWVLNRSDFADILPLKFYIVRNGEPRSGRFDLSENSWSEPVGGLQARLTFERGEETNGTPIIATYLELRNVSKSATALEVPLDPSKIEFKVTDAGGKEVAQAGLPYDGAVATPGTLRLPHDSQLRLSVSGNGVGVPKDQGGLLDLASSANWVFKRGDVGAYYLRAKIAIPKTEIVSPDRTYSLWSGTIEIPDTRIPSETNP